MVPKAGSPRNQHKQSEALWDLLISTKTLSQILAASFLSLTKKKDVFKLEEHQQQASVKLLELFLTAPYLVL